MRKIVVGLASLIGALSMVGVAAPFLRAAPEPSPVVFTPPWTSSSEPAAVAVPAPAPVVLAPAAPPPPDPQVEDLALMIAGDANRWPHAAVPHVPLADVAHDVALAVLRSGTSDYPALPVKIGPCPMQSNLDSPESRGVLALAIAFWEGRFVTYVDDQNCNDKAWRESPEGKRLMQIGGRCDGGLAVSLWQVHLDGGLLSYDPTMVTPEKMRVRAYAASVGLAMACRSLARSGSLVDYTGESAWSHPKADERLRFALRFLPKQPRLVQE